MATENLLDILHERFREALKSGRPQALKALYSDAATLLPPNRAALVGRAAIGSFWERARRIQDVVFEPTGSERLGEDVLRETGTLRLMLQGQGPQLQVREATYLSVWRRIDGDWRLDSIMWRVNNAPGARQRPRAGARQGRQGGPGGGQGGRGPGRQGGGNRPNRGNQTDDGSRGSNVRGFGPRARRNRVDQQAPMIPNLD